ncbi:MAG: hypothetical protein MZV64_38545 [Ignavibacteriales bacterium]|nr:hypothetical protein [Ignavibacteriales bacterium]
METKWLNINDSIPDDFYFSIAFHPNGDIFVGGALSTYRSTDAGVTWTEGGSVSALSMTIHPNGSLFAGAYSSVYRSDDLGNAWELKGPLVWKIYELMLLHLETWMFYLPELKV